MNLEENPLHWGTIPREIDVHLLERGNRWSRALRKKHLPRCRWQLRLANSLHDVLRQAGRSPYGVYLLEPQVESIHQFCREIWQLSRRGVDHRVILLGGPMADAPWVAALREAGAACAFESPVEADRVIKTIDRFVNSLPPVLLTLEQMLFHRLPWTPIDQAPDPQIDSHEPV